MSECNVNIHFEISLEDLLALPSPQRTAVMAGLDRMMQGMRREVAPAADPAGREEE